MKERLHGPLEALWGYTGAYLKSQEKEGSASPFPLAPTQGGFPRAVVVSLSSCLHMADLLTCVVPVHVSTYEHLHVVRARYLP